jgi:hypothetical protein
MVNLAIAQSHNLNNLRLCDSEIERFLLVQQKAAQPRTWWPHRKPAIRFWLGKHEIIGDAPRRCKRIFWGVPASVVSGF